jgi:hypothetical protein
LLAIAGIGLPAVISELASSDDAMQRIGSGSLAYDVTRLKISDSETGAAINGING